VITTKGKVIVTDQSGKERLPDSQAAERLRFSSTPLLQRRRKRHCGMGGRKSTRFPAALSSCWKGGLGCWLWN